MCSSKQIKELAECNAVYEFEKTVNMYGKEYIRYYYNKLAELNGSINSTCNCQRNSDSRENEPCCRCDSRQTNADRIRNMSDEELAEWITNICDIERHGKLYKSIYNLDTEEEEEIHDSYGDLLDWLQSEAE